MNDTKAIEIVGSRKLLAELTGVTYQQTYMWRTAIPDHRLQLMQLKRPDLFPLEKAKKQ